MGVELSMRVGVDEGVVVAGDKDQFKVKIYIITLREGIGDTIVPHVDVGEDMSVRV